MMRFRDNREELKTGKPIAAWLSRHPPTDAQRGSLSHYAIVQIGHDDRTFKSPQFIWRVVRDECRGEPALIMAVLPKPMLAAFVELVKPTPVIRALMVEESDGAVEWAGQWVQVTGMKLVEYFWTPDGEVS